MENIDEKEIKEFCSKLKYLRQSAGWTQEDLAKKVGVSRQTITGIENNKITPSFTLYIAIVGIFIMGAAISPIIGGVVSAIGLDKAIKNLFKKG